ncbi:MAG: metal ABC transporter ATP-binding protein [Clostridia bacterium]|jgi:zinc transport system ATP-binding protein|nr:metal ABC transporter ATP-binding protein [Clostridia bacterium]MCI8979835.1 metal ABC transporter ATP-binding protein [Clostridia bacterium]MCI9085222.1 metal ABC transporter ATP-binding protein [Clostridia bacterium]NDO19890.1 metal ABC transporter ATP-binding protein [Lachnospiraceae bacterium MD329]
MEILKVENLSFDYSDTSVLRDVSFTLHKGDFLGIIGANGAGKSTLIKIILKILPYSKGKITLFGEDLSRFRDNHKIGYVSQKASSFNSDFPATVKEVVMANLYSRKGFWGWYGSEDKKKLDDVLGKVGLSGYENRRVGKLSGGQQQRVFIARALISDPELLLMDEPTVGVDAQSVKQIMDIITSLNKQGITIIMTNHDTPELVRVSDKLLIFCEHGNGEFVSRANLTMSQINDIFAGKRGHHHS